MGPAPTIGGGLFAAGSGGGMCDPSTDSYDPAGPGSTCDGGPGPGGGGSGGCGTGGGGGGDGQTCSIGGGGSAWGGGGSGDGLPHYDTITSQGSNSSCGCGAGGGSGFGWGSGDVSREVQLFGSGGGSGFGDALGRRADWLHNPWIIGLTRTVGGGGGGGDIQRYVLEALPCDPPPGGPVPVPVPSSGAPVTVTTKAGPTSVRGLMVTCVETGVTLTLPCAGAVFNGDLLTYTYSALGGPGTLCVMGGATAIYKPASATNHGSSSVNITVTT